MAKFPMTPRGQQAAARRAQAAARGRAPEERARHRGGARPRRPEGERRVPRRQGAAGLHRGALARHRVDPRPGRGHRSRASCRARKVVFGATVKLTDTDSGEEVTYTIVGDHEADIKAGRIAISAPLARAMIGRERGDTGLAARPARARASTRSADVRFEAQRLSERGVGARRAASAASAGAAAPRRRRRRRHLRRRRRRSRRRAPPSRRRRRPPRRRRRSRRRRRPRPAGAAGAAGAAAPRPPAPPPCRPLPPPPPPVPPAPAVDGAPRVHRSVPPARRQLPGVDADEPLEQSLFCSQRSPAPCLQATPDEQRGAPGRRRRRRCEGDACEDVRLPRAASVHKAAASARPPLLR